MGSFRFQVSIIVIIYICFYIYIYIFLETNPKNIQKTGIDFDLDYEGIEFAPYSTTCHGDQGWVTIAVGRRVGHILYVSLNISLYIYVYDCRSKAFVPT